MLYVSCTVHADILLIHVKKTLPQALYDFKVNIAFRVFKPKNVTTYECEEDVVSDLYDCKVTIAFRVLRRINVLQEN